LISQAQRGFLFFLMVNQGNPKSTAYNLTFAILGSAGTILIKIKADVVHPYYSHTAKRTGKTP